MTTTSKRLVHKQERAQERFIIERSLMENEAKPHKKGDPATTCTLHGDCPECFEEYLKTEAAKDPLPSDPNDDWSWDYLLCREPSDEEFEEDEAENYSRYDYSRYDSYYDNGDW